MNELTLEQRSKLRAQLDHFYNNDNYYRYFGCTQVSEGIKHLFDNSDSKGFIDIIASYQPRFFLKDRLLHQHWRIEKTENKWCIYYKVLAYDSESPWRLVQAVNLSEMDFPFDEFEVHVGYLDERICGICVLSEED